MIDPITVFAVLLCLMPLANVIGYCCCEQEEEEEIYYCMTCDGDYTTRQMQVTFTDFTDSQCSECEEWNDTFILDFFLDNPDTTGTGDGIAAVCTWRYREEDPYCNVSDTDRHKEITVVVGSADPVTGNRGVTVSVNRWNGDPLSLGGLAQHQYNTGDVGSGAYDCDSFSGIVCTRFFSNFPLDCNLPGGATCTLTLL